MGLWLFSFEGHKLAVFQRDADRALNGHLGSAGHRSGNS